MTEIKTTITTRYRERITAAAAKGGKGQAPSEAKVVEYTAVQSSTAIAMVACLPCALLVVQVASKALQEAVPD